MEMFLAFIKKDIRNLDISFFNMVEDSNCDAKTYKVNYNKSMNIILKKVAMKYHMNKEVSLYLQILGILKYISNSKSSQWDFNVHLSSIIKLQNIWK